MPPSPLHRLLPRGYPPLFAHRRFRRLLPALAASDLGDGMSVVAVAWLAVRLAPPGDSGLLVGAAVTAYVLPGVVGALLLGRLVRRLPAYRLLQAHAGTRAGFLSLVPVAWAFGRLSPGLFLVLLGGSSLMYAWGGSAKYALTAQLLPGELRLAGNALLGTSAWVSTVVGPILAGVLAGLVSPAWIIGLNALSFAVLALAAGRVGRTTGPTPTGPTPTVRPVAAARGAGPRFLLSRPALLGLVAVTWLFNLCYGPVEVALPLFVDQDLHRGAGTLGLYWAAFGLGAVGGSLSAVACRRLPLWPVLLGIVGCHGLSMLPFALPGPAVVSLLGFAVAGLTYGPYSALSLSLFQELTPAALLTAVLALRTAVLLTASPLGTALGGPLTTALGPRTVLAGSGAAMVVTALCAAALRASRAGRPEPAAGA
jgi:predicted MFS family arabinose efflux permease